MAQTYTWLGNSGTWTDTGQWNPTGQPIAGDSAIAGSGTLLLSGLAISAETISFTPSSFSFVYADLQDTSFDTATSITATGTGYVELSIEGSVTASGTLAVDPGATGGPTGVYLDLRNGRVLTGTTHQFSNAGAIDLSDGATMAIYGGGGSAFVNAGQINLIDTGGLGAQLLESNDVATFTNDGTITVGTTLSPSSGASATFSGDVGGTGLFALGGGRLEFDASVASTETIDFGSSGGTLALGGDLLNAAFQATIQGFQAGDSIDLGTTLVDGVDFLNNTATLTEQGTLVATLTIDGAYQSSDFHLVPNSGGTSIYLETDTPCFAAGTRIATLRGPVAVEDLAVGEAVCLAAGGTACVTWIGRRRVLCARHPRPERVWPVRVRAEAFGPGSPVRDLLLSPDHALLLEGVLIPVGRLVNGVSILQEPWPSVQYLHVELAEHAVLLAEGVPAESYRDTGNRGQFADAGPGTGLHPEFTPLHWEGACAPLVLAGRAVDRVRRRLCARRAAEFAARASHQATHEVYGVSPARRSPSA